MVAVMETFITELWDGRHWDVSLKSDKPLDQYNSIKAELQTMKNGAGLDDMSAAERDWYRS